MSNNLNLNKNNYFFIFEIFLIGESTNYKIKEKHIE